MYKKVTSHYDVMTVGEVGHCSREEALKYVSASANELNSIFLFDLVEVGVSGPDRYTYSGWTLNDMKKAVKNMSGFAEGTDAWATAFSENHDQPRSVTRFGNDKTPKGHNKSAKLLAQMLSSLSGTLYIYQGQEIGMTNLPRSWPITEYRDIETLNYYEQFKQRVGNDKEKMEKFMDIVQLIARDHARSPVQWDSSKHGGFTTGEPWMRVNDNYPDINVASQVNDPSSVLSYWQKCLKVRKAHPETLIFGDLKISDSGHEKLFIFAKENGNKKALVVLNFSEESVPYVAEDGYKLVLTNFDENSDSHLAPYEARTYIK
jgi:alpha-glucosidase